MHNIWPKSELKTQELSHVRKQIEQKNWSYKTAADRDAWDTNDVFFLHVVTGVLRRENYDAVPPLPQLLDGELNRVRHPAHKRGVGVGRHQDVQL